MKSFRVLVEGKGLSVDAASVAAGSSGQRVSGFFVTRIRSAQSEAEAGDDALADVRREWTLGKYAAHGGGLELEVAEVETLGFLQHLWAKDSGYVFFPEKGPPHAS